MEKRQVKLIKEEEEHPDGLISLRRSDESGGFVLWALRESSSGAVTTWIVSGKMVKQTMKLPSIFKDQIEILWN